MLFNLAEVGQEKMWKGREGIPGKEVAPRKAWRWDRSWWLEAPREAQLEPPMSPGALCTNHMSHHWWGGDTSQSEQAMGVNSWDGRNAGRSDQPLPETLPVCIRTEGCGPPLSLPWPHLLPSERYCPKTGKDIWLCGAQPGLWVPCGMGRAAGPSGFLLGPRGTWFAQGSLAAALPFLSLSEN